MTDALTDAELDAIERGTLPGTSKAKLLAALRSERTQREHANTRNQVAIQLLEGQLERERTQNRELRAALQRVQVVNPLGPGSHANRVARAALSTQEATA